MATKQYFKIGVNVERKAIQFHTGTERDAVAKMQSLNHGIRLDAEPERIAQLLNDWMNEISVFKLQPINE